MALVREHLSVGPVGERGLDTGHSQVLPPVKVLGDVSVEAEKQEKGEQEQEKN